MNVRFVPAMLALAGLAGCAAGPASISLNRAAYREVINRTEDEQLFNLIVRDRYDETYGMLAVAGVTASIRVGAEAAAQMGGGTTTDEDTAGNLVPFAGGIAYEENPTISYVPIGGEKFVQRLLNPLSMEELVLMGQYLPRRPELYFSVCVKSINGVRNAHSGGSQGEAEKFNRIFQLWQELRRANVARVSRDSNGGFQAVFRADSPEHEKALAEFLELVQIAKRPAGGRLALPMRAAVAGWGDEEALNFETGSVLEIIRAAGACIDVPQSHLKSGVARQNDGGHESRFIRIHTSLIRPRFSGAIAIRYRNWWYYVDDADPDSKEAFLFLRTLVGLRLYKESKDSDVPALTLPVR